MSLTAIAYSVGSICDPEPDGMLAQLAPRAVEVLDGKVKVRLHAMRVNRFYLAEVDNKPYVYRKINDHEVEVYGLAEAASR